MKSFCAPSALSAVVVRPLNFTVRQHGMRIAMTLLGAALAVLSACAYPTRVPESFRAKPGQVLVTAVDAYVITCKQNLTTWDVQFGSRKAKYLCLVPGGWELFYPGSELKARLPRGSEYSVVRATSWSGVDAGGYVYEVIVPAYSKEPLLVSDLDTPQLFGIDARLHNIYERK
jgi:hypothetical protein